MDRSLPYTINCPGAAQEVNLPAVPWLYGKLPNGPDPNHFNPWTAPIHGSASGSATGASFSETWTFEPPLKKPCTNKESQITDVSTPNGQSTSLGELKGSGFYPGQTISADQPVELDLADGSVIRIDQGSSLTIEDCSEPGGPEPATPAKVKFALLLGAIWAKVTHAVGSPQAYEVKTERVVAGNRGTTFWMTNTRTLTTLHVVQGSMWIQGQRARGSTARSGPSRPATPRPGRRDPPSP